MENFNVVIIIISLLISGFFVFYVDDSDKKWYKSLIAFLLLSSIIFLFLYGFNCIYSYVGEKYRNIHDNVDSLSTFSKILFYISYYIL